MTTSSGLSGSTRIHDVLQRADLEEYESRKGLKKVEHLEHVTSELLQQELSTYNCCFIK